MTGFEIAWSADYLVFGDYSHTVAGRSSANSDSRLPIPFLKGAGSYIGCSTGKVDKDNCNSLLFWFLPACWLQISRC